MKLQHSLIRTVGLTSLMAFGGLILAQSGAHALTQAEIAMLKGADRQKILLEGAKKEGKVVIYSAMIVNIGLRPMVNNFMKKYPGVKAEYWRGASRKILQKSTSEVRARQITGDILEGAGVAIPAIKAGITVAFYSPELAAYPKAYYDPKGHYAGTRQSYFGTAVNTKLVAKGDAPRNFDDLLNPKWKGKLSWRAGAESGDQLFVVNALITRGDKAGEAYLKKLSANKIVNYSGSARALVDRVGQGEYPLALNIFAHHPVIAASKGAPLDVKMFEPVPVLINELVLVKGAPHPHAAVLFADFMLSVDGQKVLKAAKYFPPHPKVDPIATLHRVVPRLNNLKENIVSPKMLFEYKPKVQAILKKYFK